MDQSRIIARTEEICKEFDCRVGVVGLAIARLELAKALAEAEAAQQLTQPDASPQGVRDEPADDAARAG